MCNSSCERRINCSCVPSPLAIVLLVNSSVRDDGSSQNLMFIRGNVTSGAPSISDTSKFPKPPTVIDITMKKIITMA